MDVQSSNGAVSAEISNAVVRLVREHFGKGPTQAKTIVHDDVVVTVLRGGFTQAEKTLYKAGKGDIVDEGRRAMQDVFQREMTAAVEQLTQRRVEAFLSANHYDPDVSVEMFLLVPERGSDGKVAAAGYTDARLAVAVADSDDGAAPRAAASG
jgi:uncharacterized protein YbcI